MKCMSKWKSKSQRYGMAGTANVNAEKAQWFRQGLNHMNLCMKNLLIITCSDIATVPCSWHLYISWPLIAFWNFKIIFFHKVVGTIMEKFSPWRRILFEDVLHAVVEFLHLQLCKLVQIIHIFFLLYLMRMHLIDDSQHKRR